MHTKVSTKVKNIVGTQRTKQAGECIAEEQLTALRGSNTKSEERAISHDTQDRKKKINQ